MTPDYVQLIAHPDTPPLAVASVDAGCWFDEGRLRFRYLIKGAGKLVLPDYRDVGRADGLWRTTCFEAFIGGPGTAYREYNFAPSGQWATYCFDAPRQGMRLATDAAEVWLERGETWIAVEAAVSATFASGSPLNLTAVIEEEGGHKSYWALVHPSGRPDFHDPSCFIARLPG